MMNISKGNMYGFVTHTWNPIKGKCPHDCEYCYMKRFPVGPLRLDEKSLKDDLGISNFIFVGSSTDMWADDVPEEWILKVLSICNKYPLNTYLFQTKNPKRPKIFWGKYPKNSIMGTTLESDRNFKISNAPLVKERADEITFFSRRMVSIEPILNFNLNHFARMIEHIKPEFVSIGADSKGHNLPEPSADKIRDLISELRKFTEVKIKDNLKRLGDFR